MKGLLIKDAKVFTKKMKAYFLMILVFSAVPNGSMVGFAVMYAGMLPVTAIAYDENAKWDELAAMMPYSVFQLVFEKYALGYIMTLFSAVACFTVHSIVAYFAHTMTATFPLEMAVYVCVAFFITALDMPIILRFGTEKGRWVFMSVTIAIAVLCASNIEVIIALFRKLDAGDALFLPLLFAAALLANAVSLPLSLASYKKRYRA